MTRALTVVLYIFAVLGFLFAAGDNDRVCKTVYLVFSALMVGLLFLMR